VNFGHIGSGEPDVCGHRHGEPGLHLMAKFDRPKALLLPLACLQVELNL
jgi:hypothetical protein